MSDQARFKRNGERLLYKRPTQVVELVESWSQSERGSRCSPGSVGQVKKAQEWQLRPLPLDRSTSTGCAFIRREQSQPLGVLSGPADKL